MKAVLYNKFPKRFLKEVLLPGFVAIGVEILRTVNPERQEVKDLKGAEIVIIMWDLMSGTHRKQIRKFAKTNRMKAVELTRKKADWPRILGLEKEPDVPNVKSVKDEDVELMLRKYVELMESDATEDEILEGLKPFWTGRVLEKHQTAIEYVRRQVKAGRAPSWFRNWSETQKRSIKAPPPVPPSMRTMPRPPPSIPEPENSAPSIPEPENSAPESVQSEPEMEEDEELRELVRMYEEENDELRQELKTTTAKANNTRSKLEEAWEELSRPRPVIQTSEDMTILLLAIGAVERLCDSDVMDDVEALRKIFTLARRARGEGDRKLGKLKVVAKT